MSYEDLRRNAIMLTGSSLGPNIIRVLPSTCVTFLVYENMKFYLPRMWQGNDFEEQPEAAK